MLYIDDRLPSHPKIFKAGARLPDNGAAQVLAVYLAGLAYAREHLTDGFLPAGFINSLVVFSQTPQDVVNALVSRGVQLWHKVPGGYRIHDYLDWNEKASQVKDKRKKWRAKKAAQRRKGNGAFAGMSPGDTPREEYRDSRAPVPRSKYRTVPTSHDRTVRVGSTSCVLTGAPAPACTHPTKTPTRRPLPFATLCAMARAEFDTTIDNFEWSERIKLRLVRQGFAYPAPHRLPEAMTATEHALAKAGQHRGVA